MLKVSINPNLKIFHFDGDGKTVAEIAGGAPVSRSNGKANIRANIGLPNNPRRRRKTPPLHWGGWKTSRSLKTGDFIAAEDKTIQILKPEEFHRFFVVENV